jgi:hypothetical protein
MRPTLPKLGDVLPVLVSERWSCGALELRSSARRAARVSSARVAEASPGKRLLLEVSTPLSQQLVATRGDRRQHIRELTPEIRQPGHRTPGKLD